MMRVHVKIHGPLDWQCEVLDMETGRRLPVLQNGLRLEVRDGHWVLVCSMLIEEATAFGVELVPSEAP